jgi:hypothetical protein
MQEEEKWVASQEAVRKRDEEKKKEEEEKKKKSEELQAGLAAYYTGRKQGETNVITSPPKKTWVDKAWDFADEHQAELALIAGVGIGLVAVVLTGGLALAPAVVAIGSMIAAGVVVGGGTVALNAHFDRPWHENLARNAAIAGGAALVTSGALFLMPKVLTGVSSYCAVHQSTCARVETVSNAIDKVEEISLRAKLGYQTWTGDQAGAAETAFDLHTEYLDGGLPGNVVAKKLGDQFTDIRKNILPVIRTYGTDVIPILVKHGDEGLALIQKYGDNGIAWLLKYGNDATGFVHLDPDVLDYVTQQGPDALEALSRWSADELRDHGIELALRANKDA